MSISIKNKSQIENMRVAGKVLAEALSYITMLVKPGINCLMIDKKFGEFINEKKCKVSFKGYGGFPNNICISINEQLIHGIPTNRILKDGDIVSLDTGCTYNGWHADSALTIICGNSNSKYDKLVKVTQKSLYLAIKQIKPGVRLGTISNTVQEYVEGNGYYLPTDYAGHGIGSEMHEDPIISNVGLKDTGMRLAAGMVICIEPMVQVGTAKTRVLKDDWTVISQDKSMTAHFEHTILVTEDGYEVLTKRQEESEEDF
ncbi:type I methionyl aminopeptidase [Spiroplasma endosymbiont of Labia minor]|uniref:type I methionyl aminopeptidase n=1 Tax=Spiroplasma endosymbiont of Labia minor TaxID=3066305 RepID=UPI0030CFCEA2